MYLINLIQHVPFFINRNYARYKYTSQRQLKKSEIYYVAQNVRYVYHTKVVIRKQIMFTAQNTHLKCTLCKFKWKLIALFVSSNPVDGMISQRAFYGAIFLEIYLETRPSTMQVESHEIYYEPRDCYSYSVSVLTSKWNSLTKICLRKENCCCGSYVHCRGRDSV